MAQSVRKRIAPTPVVYTDAFPEPHAVLEPLPLQPSAAANGATKLPATRRMHVKLPDNRVVNFKEVFKQHAGQEKAKNKTVPHPGEAEADPLDKVVVEKKPPGAGNVFTDVIKSLENRFMAGAVSDSEESDQGDGSGSGSEEDGDEEGAEDDGKSSGEGSEEDGDEQGTTEAEDVGGSGAEGKAARSPKPVRERFEAYEEDFIDDTDIIRARRGTVRTKYSGFFVNKGRVDKVEDAAAVAREAAEKKRKPPRAPKPAAGAGAAEGAAKAAAAPGTQPAGEAGTSTHAAPAKKPSTKRRAEPGTDAAADTPAKKKVKPMPAANTSATSGTAAAAASSAAQPNAPVQAHAATAGKKPTMAQLAALAGKQAAQKTAGQPSAAAISSPAAAPPTASLTAPNAMKEAAEAAALGRSSAGPSAAATPSRKGRQLKSVDELVEGLVQKLSASQVDAEGAFKMAQCRQQLVNIAAGLYREFGAEGQEEQLGRAALRIADTEGGKQLFPSGADSVRSELARLQKDALKQLDSLSQDMEKHVQAYSAERAEKLDAELDAKAVGCLDKLLQQQRKIHGVDGDLLARVASWDTTQTLQAGMLQQLLEKEKVKSKKRVAGGDEGQAAPAAAKSKPEAGAKHEAAANPDPANKSKAEAEAEPGVVVKKPKKPKTDKGEKGGKAQAAEAVPSTATLAGGSQAGSLPGSQEVPADGGDATKPVRSLTPDEDNTQLTTAVVAAIRLGAESEQIQQDAVALANTPVGKALFKAACYMGKGGAKTRELLNTILDKGFMPSWSAPNATDKVSQINTVLKQAKVSAVLVHIGDYKYALRCFGIPAVPRPEKKASTTGPTQAPPDSS